MGFNFFKRTGSKKLAADLEFPDLLKTESGAPDNSIEQQKPTRYLPYEEKAVYITRQDIQDWNMSQAMALSLYPVNYRQQLLYDRILVDALLTSQVENRLNQLYSASFSLKKADGTVDEDETNTLKNHPLHRFFVSAIFDKKLRGNRVVELTMTTGADGKPQLTGNKIPCANIVQQTGLFYPDYFNSGEYIKYREMPEFGTWVLEFTNEDTLGLLNKVVPHVLFKRFAQTCWSKLCEIYGTPPRVMKTNTQDPIMLSRARQMMKDMGNASYFIIDDKESFDWAHGVATDGAVYKSLIDLCRDEICLAISGAIIGQDTKNGARSKDMAAQEMLWLLVQADMNMAEADYNNIIMPALVKHGIIKPGLTFAYDPYEDMEQLWQRTQAALQYYTIEPDWIKTKFGIEVKELRPQPLKGTGSPSPEGGAPDGSKLMYKGSKAFFGQARQAS